jgi:hypothetical protein
MAMTTTQPHLWYEANQSTANLTCEYCQASAYHELWCITQNFEVMKAWQAVLDPAKLSVHDQLILHALGVAWIDTRQAPRKTKMAIL